MALDPTVVALVGTIMGGVGLKVVEWWLSKNRVKTTDASQIRSELREELAALRAENKYLESELDKWKKDFYDQYATIIQLKAEAQISGRGPPTE